MLLVGDEDGTFVREAVQLAGEYELATVRCDDVYSAVAELARDGDPQTVVAGTFRDLARENGTFFALARHRGVRCCCLLEPNAAEREMILAAVRLGVHPIGESGDLRAFLESWLAESRRRVLLDDTRMTEAELRALLGRPTDG